MKNIYVGNLDITTTESQLRELFQAYGTVNSVTLVNDRDTGAPRGFAFIEMGDDSEAAKAIEAVNGMKLADRSLTANEARPKEGRGPDSGRLATRKHRQHRY